MDFMNLNQSAHGDREFGHLATRLRLRRKTVAGHWSDPSVVRRIATWSRAACGWHEAQGLAVARFGDNMRQVAVTEGDKVEAAASTRDLGERLRRRRARGRGRSGRGLGGGSAGRRIRGRLRRRPAAGRRRRAARGAARRRADRGGPACVARGRRLHGVHRHLRGPARAGAASGDRRPEAHGRRLRVRRGGRLEDRRAAPDPEGDEHGPRGRHVVHGGLHLRPRSGRPEGARRAHARGVSVDRRRPAVVRDPPAVDRREERPRPAGVHGGAGAGVRRQPGRSRRPLPPGRERGRGGHAPARPPEAAGRAGALAAEAEPGDRRGRVARRRRGPPHGALLRPRDRGPGGPGGDRRPGADRHRRGDTRCATSPTSCAGTRPTTLGRSR